jgi:hypothetical protein
MYLQDISKSDLYPALINHTIFVYHLISTWIFNSV